MNESALAVRAGVPHSASTEALRERNPKLDQWICFWSIPFFYNLFGLIFVLLARIMPPPSPTASVEDVLAYMQAPKLGIGMALLSLTLGLASLSSGVIVVQMKRMEGVSPVLPYAYLTALAVAGVPGCLFPGFVFALGNFRPEYGPQIQQMLEGIYERGKDLADKDVKSIRTKLTWKRGLPATNWPPPCKQPPLRRSTFQVRLARHISSTASTIRRRPISGASA